MAKSSLSRWYSFVCCKTLSQRSWKPRDWITFLQDHHLAGDEPFWQDNKNTGPVHSVREDLGSVRAAIGSDGNFPVLEAEVGQAVSRTERHFTNLETDTAFLFRLFWLMWTLPFIGWTFYLAIILEEWGQLVQQLAILSRTLSFGIALLRYKKGNGWLILKFYEDRVLGGFPSLIFYTITSRPAYRHLHGNWRYTVLVAGISCLGLLLLSFWRDLWINALFLWSKLRPVPPKLTGDARIRLRTARDKLLKDVEDLQKHIENVDIGDRMKDYFLMMKRDADRLLRTIDRFLLMEDAVDPPCYPRRPKVVPVLLTTILVGQCLGAYFRYPWLMAETAGWGLWVELRMVSDWMRAHVSQDDMFRLFSTLVVGAIALLPLTISLLCTKGAVLLSITNRVLLAISLVLLINLFSNLIGTFCKRLGNKNWRKSFLFRIGKQLFYIASCVIEKLVLWSSHFRNVL
jgi:hypothetical protein